MTHTVVELTADQARLWGETKSAVQWITPSYTYLLYNMMNRSQRDSILIFTKDIATLATDGTSIIANPDYLFGLTLPKRVSAVCHEIGHAIFHHCMLMHQMKKTGTISNSAGKVLPYDHKQMNIMMDYIINDMNKQSSVGELDKTWYWDPKKGSYKDSYTDVYFRNYKKTPPPDGAQKGQDEHLEPGAADGLQPDDPAATPNPAEWRAAIAGAKMVGQAAGKLPDAMKYVFDQILEPVVNWTDHIQAIFNRTVGNGTYDYRKPDRRMIVRDIVIPGRSGFGAGTVAIGLDTSGSIYAIPKLIERFLAEIVGILEDVRPRQVIIFQCDAVIHQVDVVTDVLDIEHLRKVGVKGGGGTSFKKPFQWLAKNDVQNLDCMLYLTDGDGDFPDEAPDCPVIWGDISGDASKYPWGEVVHIPTDGSA